jgi:hypothetical protein
MRGTLRARIANVLSSDGMQGVWVEPTEAGPSGDLTAYSTPSEQNRTEIQSPEKRKRPAATLMTPPSTAGEDEDEDEDDRHFSYRKTRRQSHQRNGSPVVLLPNSAEYPDLCNLVDPNDSLAQSTHSPESPKALRGQMLLRRNMAPIQTTPEKHRAAQAPLRDIPEEEAHPPLPRFLFRAFTAGSQGLNSPNGFVFGRYADARAPPPGPPRNLEWNEVLEHLDPSKTLVRCLNCKKTVKCCNKTLHQKLPSSCISTSSDLIWVIRKMIAQGEQSYLSVIDTSGLDPLSVFYVPPYQRELARK